MSITIVELRLSGTTPQYRAGIGYILDYVHDYLISSKFDKDGLLKQLSSCVGKLEDEMKDDEFRKGLYSGFGWYRHALHNIIHLDDVGNSELKAATNVLRREINVLGT